MSPLLPLPPCDPVLPVDPVSPTGPVDPVLPTGPVDPVLPTGPVDPIAAAPLLLNNKFAAVPPIKILLVAGKNIFPFVEISPPTNSLEFIETSLLKILGPDISRNPFTKLCIRRLELPFKLGGGQSPILYNSIYLYYII